MGFLIVFLGAGIGGAARYGVNLVSVRLLGSAFPYGTLAINVIGCFVMGVVADHFARQSGLSQDLRLFLTTGILGGFTTFSAFSLDAALLWQRGEAVNAALYVGASVVLSLAGVASGMAVSRFLFGASL